MDLGLEPISCNTPVGCCHSAARRRMLYHIIESYIVHLLFWSHTHRVCFSYCWTTDSNPSVAIPRWGVAARRLDAECSIKYNRVLYRPPYRKNRTYSQSGAGSDFLFLSKAFHFEFVPPARNRRSRRLPGFPMPWGRPPGSAPGILPWLPTAVLSNCFWKK